MGPPISGAAAVACRAALLAHGVRTTALTLFPDYVLPQSSAQTVVLPVRMRGGPVVPAGASYSPLEADYLNLLSSAVGLPLGAYRDKSLTLLYLDLPNSGPIGSYACLETAGHSVAGLLAQQLNYNFQPLFDVATNGQTADALVKGGFFAWIARRGDFVPKATRDRPGLTAQEALMGFLGVLDDPSLSVSARQNLIAGYGTYGKTLPKVFKALVPMSIASYAPPEGPLPNGSAVFTVMLWPVFRHFSTMYLAGDGWQGGYISLRRMADGIWQVTDYSTGY